MMEHLTNAPRQIPSDKSHVLMPERRYRIAQKCLASGKMTEMAVNLHRDHVDMAPKSK